MDKDKKFEDLRQTREWANYLNQIGWRVVKVSSLGSNSYDYLYVKKLPLLPFGVAKFQRPKNEVDFKKLLKQCNINRVKLVYFEPNLRVNKSKKIDNQLKKFGFRKTKDAYLPKKTVWIDLKKSSTQILREMKPKTRYNIKLAMRRDVKVKVINGRQFKKDKVTKKQFLDLVRHNARRLGIFALPQKWYDTQIKSFGQKCFAVLAYKNSKLVAGNFFLCSKTVCFHSHNDSVALGRKLMAPSLCVWEGIREAKKRKLKIFDFGGIYDGSRWLKKWQGFSKFKLSFGGKIIVFMSQFSKLCWF